MKKPLLATLLSLTSLTNVAAQNTPTQVTNIGAGLGSYPSKLTVMNNKLYFMADPNLSYPRKSWSYDGTNLTAASEFNPAGSVILNDGSYPFGVANNRYYVSGYDMTSSEAQLYYGDGVDTFKPLVTPLIVRGPFVTVNNIMYGYGNDGVNSHLVSVDASNVVTPVANLGTYYNLRELVLCSNMLYFTATDGNNFELFAYDLSTSIFTLIPSINSSDGSDPENLHAGDDGKVYYSAEHPTDGRELYEISGTTPTKLTSLGIGGGVAPAQFNAHCPRSILKKGNNVYFSGNNGAGDYELMKYDLTTSIASQIKNIEPFLNSSNPTLFTEFGGKVYFAAHTTAEGLELWVTDGTEAGTTMVADLYPGWIGGGSGEPTVYNNKLYFVARNGTSGIEVFRLGNPLGIEAVTKTKSINIYPVPTGDVVNFEIELINAESLYITLTDLSGRKVYRTKPQQFEKGIAKVAIPVKDLTVGMYTYMITLANGEVIGTGKISN